MTSPSDFREYMLNGRRIRHLDEVNSTNSYLESIHSTEKLADGFTVIADYQTNGRGQHGSTWESEKGKNLLFSFLHFPENLAAERQFYISKVVSIAITRVLEVFSNLDVKIKWPNDIYINGKKAVGTLIQNSIKGHLIQHTYIGVGVNVNQRVFHDLAYATSVRNENGVDFNKAKLFEQLLLELDKSMKMLVSKRFIEIDQLYFANLLGYGEWLNYQSESGISEGKIIDILQSGQLRIEDREGRISTYNFKEISLISAQRAL